MVFLSVVGRGGFSCPIDNASKAMKQDNETWAVYSASKYGASEVQKMS